ncbi:MAG: hypothetical protein ACLFPV_05980 [Spirochaetaceae bacterium]
MNTTPSTSNIDYTVVGGRPADRDSRGRLSLSILVLHRAGSLPRPDLYEELQRWGGQEIISVASAGGKAEGERLSQRFPSVRFIIPSREIGIGARINLAMEEARGRLVCVTWNQVTFEPFSPRLLDGMLSDRKLCYAPILRTRKGEVVPTVVAPALFKSTLKVLFLPPSGEERPTLFPFDYIGVYDRERFRLLGGYDTTIHSSYWQKMDFGFRTYLWGEETAVRSDLRAQSDVELPTEDTTPDQSYMRFFLKNLAPRFDGSGAILPKGKILPLLFRGGVSVAEALRLMREIRSWVQENRYRFLQDAKRVTELWDTNE